MTSAYTLDLYYRAILSKVPSRNNPSLGLITWQCPGFVCRLAGFPDCIINSVNSLKHYIPMLVSLSWTWLVSLYRFVTLGFNYAMYFIS